MIYRAKPVHPAETARMAAYQTSLACHCSHAGQAVCQASVDVVFFTNGRDSLAVINIRQIGLSLQVRGVEKWMPAARSP